MREYAGRVRLVVKDLPLARHELARGAHEAARCAGAAGQYWAYHDRLYAAQAAFERAKLIRYAADLGIDTVAFTRCLDRREFARAVERRPDVSRYARRQSAPRVRARRAVVLVRLPGRVG